MLLQSGISVTPEMRDAWLSERRKSLGASDVAAVIGAHPYKTAMGVYLEKTGQAEDGPTSEPAEIGLLMEPVIATLYGRRTGSEVVRQQVFARHPVRTFLTATLDGITDSGRVVEFKAIGARSAGGLGAGDADTLPLHWVAQVQMQLACSGLEEADIAVLVGGQEFRIYHLDRDDDVIEALARRAEAFWGRVERREAPRPDLDRGDARLLAGLYPEPEGDLQLEGLPDHDARLYLSLGREIKGLQDRRDQHRDAVLAAMKSHARARTGDGRVLVRKVVATKERTQVVRATTYATLTESKPKKGD